MPQLVHPGRLMARGKGWGQGGGAPAWIFPNAAPDIDFANNRYWDGVTAGQVSSILTVSRASSAFAQNAAGTFISFATDQPRLTDLGLLAENAATTLVQQNADGNNAVWTKVSQTATPGQTSPDGGTSAFLLTNVVASSTHSCNAASASFTSGTTYCGWGIFKAGTDVRVQLTFGTAAFSGSLRYANFDLTGDGSVTAQGSGLVSAGCLPVGGGWFLCYIVATATSTAATGAVSIIRINAGSATRNPTYTPGSADTIFVWLPQVAVGTFPSSPILNETSGTLTRPADNVTITSTLAKTGIYAAKSAYDEIFACNFATANVVCNINAALLEASAATKMQTNNGTLNAEATIPSAGTILGLTKTAHSFDGVNLTAVANASTLATTAAVWGATSGTIQVGNNAALTRSVQGYIKRLAFSATASNFDTKTSPIPLWQAAKAAQIAGTRNARILVIGDSTTAGWGSQNSAGHANDAALGTIAQLSALLAGGSWQSQFCDQNTLSGAGGTIPLNVFDSRVTLGSWVQTSYTAGVAASVGGSLLTCASGTTAYTFTPTTSVDTFDFYYITDTTNGVLSYQVDSGSVTQINTAAAQSVQKVTISAGSLAAHTLKIARVSGSVAFLGTIATNSAAKEITIINGGWSGSVAADWNVANGAWDPTFVIPLLAPDLTIIDLTINDWVANTFSSTYRASLQALVTLAKQTGDVMLLSGVPSNTVSASLANQNSKLGDYATIANVNGLTNVNQTPLFTSWTAATVALQTFDNLHYNSTGYAVTAAALAALL